MSLLRRRRDVKAKLYYALPLWLTKVKDNFLTLRFYFFFHGV